MKSRHTYANIFQLTVKMFHNIAVIARIVVHKVLGVIPFQVLLLCPVSCPSTNTLYLNHTSTATLQPLYADIGFKYKTFTATCVEIFFG
jgi:hypothetical protein